MAYNLQNCWAADRFQVGAWVVGPSETCGNSLLDCPASEPILRAIYGSTTAIFDLWTL